MLVLNRSIYTQVRNDYSWVFDTEDLEELQAEVNKVWISENGDQAPQITFEDIEYIFEDDIDSLDPIFNERREFTTGHNTLACFIYDYLDSYIIDYWQNEEYLDNDDFEDEVVRYDE